MLHSFHKYLLVLVTALLLGIAADAAVKVTASLDSAKIIMGRVDTLRLIVDREKNVQGVFPLFRNAAKDGYVTLLGDTVELRAPRLDTLRQDGSRITERLVVPVQVFDSGFYRLPPFVYLTANDSVTSNSVELTVYPVAVGDNETISDYKDITDPSDKSFWDWMPDWLYELWWLWIVILAGIAVIIWLSSKYRRTGKFISLPEKPQPKPWTIALQRLERLKAKNLWENGMEKEYFTELTDIIRDYLSARFGINAMEMTSRQIMETLASQPDVKNQRAYIRKILDMSDFVKFAKVRPLPSDNVDAYDSAVSFVRETEWHETSAEENSTTPPPIPIESKQNKNSIKKGGDR